MNREIFRKMVFCAVLDRYEELELSAVNKITTMIVSIYDTILSDNNFTISINYSDSKTSITIRDRYANNDNNIACLLDVSIHLREEEVILYYCDTVIVKNTINERVEDTRRFTLKDFE